MDFYERVVGFIFGSVALGASIFAALLVVAVWIGVNDGQSAAMVLCVPLTLILGPLSMFGFFWGIYAVFSALFLYWFD